MMLIFFTSKTFTLYINDTTHDEVITDTMGLIWNDFTGWIGDN